MVVEAPQLMRRLCGVLLLAVTAGAAAQDYAVDGGCRDGELHGAYELRSASGQVRVVGAFARGKRTGSFLFWSSAGARIAQLPFADDVLSGTVALWYLPVDRKREGQPKLEAVYVAGRLHGTMRSWHPNGRVRAEYRHDKGALLDARAFGEGGKALSEADARALAVRDLATDDNYFATLTQVVRSNRPHCAPVSERLERP